MELARAPREIQGSQWQFHGHSGALYSGR
jgi:hypothetical protein